MMEYDARKKFNRETSYNVFCYLPLYILEEQSKTGKVELSGVKETKNRYLNTYYSFNELLELYKEYEEDINIFSETNLNVNFENPDYHDFLNLANDINAYSGL